MGVPKSKHVVNHVTYVVALQSIQPRVTLQVQMSVGHLQDYVLHPLEGRWLDEA